jgi:GT2 family glycosyltransferase
MMAPNGPLFNFRKAAQSPTRRFRFFYTANLSIASDTLGEERFDERFTTAAFEDTELGVRLERAGVALVYRPDLVVYHRHALAATDLAARLRALRDGQRVLSDLHPELAPGLGGRLRNAILSALVWAWRPLEGVLGLGPTIPRDWTNEAG